MRDLGGVMENAPFSFPAGLEQPQGSFRFSLDALILGEYAADCCGETASLCDLGSGCGIVAFAALRKRPSWTAVGVEKELLLAEAAQRNAVRLGLAGRYASVCGDVCDQAALREARARLQGMWTDCGENPLFDIVACNPPWRRDGAGRTPPSDLRRRALFGEGETFSYFFSAADKLLKNRGLLAVLTGAERTADLLASLPQRLHPEVLRFYCRGQAARRVIMLARKNGRADLSVESVCLHGDSAL